MRTLILAGLLLALTGPALADNSQPGSPEPTSTTWLEKPKFQTEKVSNPPAKARTETVDQL
jgi:hypothetical protein